MAIYRNKENSIQGLRKDLELLNGNYAEALENTVVLSRNEENSKKVIDTLTNNNEEVRFFNSSFFGFIEQN